MSETRVRAVIQVDAQTAGARHELSQLEKQVEAVGKATTKATGGWKGFVTDITDGFAKFNLAMGGVEKAFEMLNKGIDIAIQQSRAANMEKMLPVGTVDRFREATDKMIGRQEVLRLSVKGMTGDYALTAKEMETVLKASVALSQRFGEASDVIANKLLDALAKGVNKLDDFGIELEKTGNRQYDVNAAMGKFNELISTTEVDESTKNLAALKDSLEGIGTSIKNVIAEAVKGIAWLVEEGKKSEGSKMAFGWLDSLGRRIQPQVYANAERVDPLVAYNRELSASETNIDASRNDPRKRVLGPGNDERGMSNEDWIAAEQYRLEKWRNRKPGANVPLSYHKPGDLYLGDTSPYLPGTDLPVGQISPLQSLSPLDVVVVGFGAIGAFDKVRMGEMGQVVTGRDRRSLAALGGSKRAALGGLGGGESFVGGGAESSALMGTLTGGYDPSNPLGSMSSKLNGQNAFGGGAFDAGTAGMLAGMEAVITGQDAVGKSIARASANALKAKAIEWGAFAVGELAWGFADLASGLPTATMHFTSAAKFGAAAAAAGLGAAALGALAGSGGGASGHAGGGYASPTRTSGGGGAGDTIVINIGDGFVGDAKGLADTVAGAVRDAKRRGKRDNFSASFSG